MEHEMHKDGQDNIWVTSVWISFYISRGWKLTGESRSGT